MWILVNFIATILAGILDNVLHTTYSNQNTGIISTLYSLGVLLPGLGVAIRRMHDIGKSGWWVLIVLIPVVGFIWYIAATEGLHGENQYGPDPKAKPGLIQTS